jgi:hypothetical protein
VILRQVGRELHPGSKQLLNGILLFLVLGAAAYWFYVYLPGSGLAADRPQLFGDANTYQAAVNRVNGGHRLYEFTAADMSLLIIPWVWVLPLLSAPPIAGIWMVLAVVPFGYWLWIAAAWAATIAAVAYFVLKAPLPAVPLAVALSLPIGEPTFGANACALYPLFCVLAWRFRGQAWIGTLIAIMAAIKLAPIGMAAWLIGTRQYRAIAVMMESLAALFLVGALAGGFASYIDWLRIIPTMGPSPMSLSGITGLPMASYSLIAIWGPAALLIGRRWSAGSFVVAPLASVIGTPALWPGHLGSLLAVAVPVADPEKRGRPADEDPVAQLSPRVA